jgi:hypothetical protein
MMLRLAATATATVGVIRAVTSPVISFHCIVLDSPILLRMA